MADPSYILVWYLILFKFVDMLRRSSSTLHIAVPSFHILMDSISPSFGVQLSPIFSLFRISYTSDLWGYFSLFTKIPNYVVIEPL